MAVLIRYGLYPVLLICTLAAALISIYGDADLQRVFVGFAAVRLAVLFVVEWAVPCRKEWAMTWRSFFRDLKYAVVLGGGGFAVKFLAGWLAIGLAERPTGALSHWPVVLQFIVLALTYEFFQYWQHRYSHTARGALGKFFWRTHVQHHLPSRVYLFMHVVAHPINFILVTIINVAVIRGLGVGENAVFLFNVMLGLQGLVSHFNVKISAGPMNYLLVGTELHRIHHSAHPEDAGNYGVLTPFWDIVFGTFRYHPDREPTALGVYDPQQYPSSNQIVAAMMLPFRSAHRHAGDEP